MVSVDRNPLGVSIAQHRRRTGLTQREAASLAGTSVAGLRDIEQGRVTRPRLSTLRRLATVLRLSRPEFDALLATAEGSREAHRTLRVEILGPMRLFADGTPVDLGSQTQRVLFAALALTPNIPVHRDVLSEAVWPRQTRRDRHESLQSRISRLRRKLRTGESTDAPDGIVQTTHQGYQLAVTQTQHDLLTFRRLTADARTAVEVGRTTEACGLFADAVGLWRGDPLTDIPALHGHPEISRLEREFTTVVLEYAAAASEVGRYQDVLPLLQRLAEADPLHETVHGALMVALAGCGQQSAALRVFDALRRRLAEELGADPGAAMVDVYHRILRQEIARPESAPVTVHDQIPADIVHFTGRQQALRSVREQLARDDSGTAVPIVAVEGMAGVGKTRLAVRAAHQLLSEGYYTDCQLYVDLRDHADQRPADPAAVLASFLRLLGVPGDRIPKGLDERAALYRDRLYGRKALVLLDNSAGEDQVLPLLPSGPTNAVLITSRRALALDGMRTVTLDVLGREEALDLLGTMVGSHAVEAERGAAERVVEACGGLPLAIVLAARRLQSRTSWTIGDLAARLAGARGRLEELSTGESLRAVFDLSYQALVPDERLLFRRLGLHPGDSFTIESAAMLAELPLVETRNLLDQLADGHLVSAVAGNRYRLHDLLADYARSVVDAEEDAATRRAAVRRLFDFYLHTAARAAQLLQPHEPITSLVGTLPAHRPVLTSQETARQWLDDHRACLIASVRAAVDSGLPAHAWQLTTALRDYLNLYGHNHDQDWVRTHEAALAAALASGDEAGEAMTRFELGTAHMNLGHASRAHEHLEGALALYRKAGNRAMESNVLGTIGILHYRTGRFRTALEHFRSAAALCTDPDPYREGVLWINQGIMLTALGRVEEAFPYYEHGLRLSRQVGNLDGEGCVLADIGDAYRRLGRFDQAIESLKTSMTVSASKGLVPKVGYALHRLGNTYCDLDRIDEAKDKLYEALRIVRTVSSPATESEVLVDMATVHRKAGELTAAGEFASQALRLAVSREERYQQARAHAELAKVHRHKRRFELAEHNRTLAVGIIRSLGLPEDHVDTSEDVEQGVDAARLVS